MMSEPISLDQWRALAEGAGYAISEPLRRLSAKPAAKSGDAGPEMPRMMIGRRIGSSTIDSGPELEVADDGYFLRLERRLNLPGPTAVAEKSGTINANP